MEKIKYDINSMKIMSLFNTITKAKLKDCIIDGNIIFIVQPDEIGKAIGKNGANVKKLEGILNKKIKIVEFSDDILRFVVNFVAPLKVKEIKEEDKIITITSPDTKTRGYLIGRNAINLRNLENIIRRYFDVTEIKVI